MEHLDRMGQAMYLLTCVPCARGGGDLIDSDSNLMFIGSWLGDRIAIVGDYSIDDDLPSFPGFGNVYRECTSQVNPMYDCWGMRRRSKDLDNVWRDITADLSLELKEAVGLDWIPSDHPTLWPDGTRKSDDLIQRAKDAKNLMKDWQDEVK